MPYVEVDDDRPARVRIAANWVDKDRMREVPGATWSHSKSVWTAPKSWATYVILHGVFDREGEVELGPKFQDWVSREYHSRVFPCEEMRELVSFDETPRPLPPLPAAAQVTQGWTTRGRER